jgi:hypothetical protein
MQALVRRKGDRVTVSFFNPNIYYVHAETSFMPAGYNVAMVA